MSNITETVNVTVLEGAGATILARVIGNAGAVITQASITSIAFSMWDESVPATPIAAATAITVSTSVYDTLQTDARWTADTTGFNFEHTITATLLADGNKFYRVEYTFTPAAGQIFRLPPYRLHTLNFLTD